MQQNVSETFLLHGEMAQGKLKVKSKVPAKSVKKNSNQRAVPTKLKKGNKIIKPKKQAQQVRIMI